MKPATPSADLLGVPVYRYANRATCRRCGMAVVWWHTPPSKKKPKGSKMLIDEAPFREALAKIVPLAHIDPGDFSVDRRLAHQLILPFFHQRTCVPGRK